MGISESGKHYKIRLQYILNSQGLIFKKLRVEDYQELIDRGWRRSGSYVYKPSMEKTCCPLYTIRCDANKFQPTKSQRKTIKQVHNFINNGKKDSTTKDTSSNVDVDNSIKKEKTEKENPRIEKHFKKAQPCNKQLKSARQQKFIQKLLNISGEEMKDIKLTNNTPKNLNDLNPTQGSFCVNRKVLQSSPDSSHKYELRLVRADLEDPDFLSTIRESYQVYKKYQMKIHNDSEADCDINSYAGFLCNSPLMYRQDISNRSRQRQEKKYLV